MAKFFARWFKSQSKQQPRHKAPKWQPVTKIPSYNNAEAFGY